MDDDPLVLRAVLLTATDDTARGQAEQARSRRRAGTHLEQSRQRAAELDQQTPAWVKRLSTDGRTIRELGAEVLTWLGWA